MPAADAVYRFAVEAGRTIDASLRPEGFDGGMYLLGDCSMDCLALANDNGVSGTEQLSITAAASGDLFVVVDSPSSIGCYELTVSAAN